MRIQDQTRLYNETLSEKKKNYKKYHKTTNTQRDRYSGFIQMWVNTNTYIQILKTQKNTDMLNNFISSGQCGKSYCLLWDFISGSSKEHSSPDFVLGKAIFPQ